MQKLKVGVAIAVTCLLSWASVVAYHVEPRTVAMSGWTRLPPSPNYYVAQTITCCWDSLERIELFAGAKGNGASYHVAVYDSGIVKMWSDGDTVPDHGWVRFQNWNRRIAFTKGKQYKFQFSRGSNDSIWA